MRGDQPANLGSTITHGHDMSAAAFDIYKHLDEHRPVHIPSLRSFSTPDLLKKWRTGSPMPEEYQAEFLTWMEAAQARTDRIQENQRRLRSTMWAESLLRGTEYQEYADSLAEFHRIQWRIAMVPPDRCEREAILRDVVTRLARGSQ
jgi:hypothetical protein